MGDASWKGGRGCILANGDGCRCCELLLWILSPLDDDEDEAAAGAHHHGSMWSVLGTSSTFLDHFGMMWSCHLHGWTSLISPRGWNLNDCFILCYGHHRLS